MNIFFIPISWLKLSCPSILSTAVMFCWRLYQDEQQEVCKHATYSWTLNFTYLYQQVWKFSVLSNIWLSSGDICQQFTKEMFDMYQGFACYKNWDFEVYNYTPAEYGE